MKICRTCGLIRSRGTCDHCKASDTATVPDPEGLFAVSLRCRFQCRSCGHLSPLDGLAASGSVTCARCATEQAFDTTSWSSALAHAHAVGDLCQGEGRHPHPDVSIAAINPHADIGVGRSAAELRLEGIAQTAMGSLPRTLQIIAAPGHPTCATCATPLQWSASDGGAQTTCPGCEETATYALSASALALHAPARRHGGLVAALAPEHRTDGTPAAVTVRAHNHTFSCSSCGAPLQVRDGTRFVSCRFCHTTALIPSQALSGLQPERPPALWWVIFSGAAPLRRELESGEVSPLSIERATPQPLSRSQRLARMGAVVAWGGTALVLTGAVVIALRQLL